MKLVAQIDRAEALLYAPNLRVVAERFCDFPHFLLLLFFLLEASVGALANEAAAGARAVDEHLDAETFRLRKTRERKPFCHGREGKKTLLC